MGVCLRAWGLGFSSQLPMQITRGILFFRYFICFCLGIFFVLWLLPFRLLGCPCWFVVVFWLLGFWLSFLVCLRVLHGFLASWFPWLLGFLSFWLSGFSASPSLASWFFGFWASWPLDFLQPRGLEYIAFGSCMASWFPWLLGFAVSGLLRFWTRWFTSPEASLASLHPGFFIVHMTSLGTT